MQNKKSAAKWMQISLIPLVLAQLLMAFPLSLWERFGPGPDVVIYSPISYYHWAALVGRAGNWLAVVVSILMPLWLALTIRGLRYAAPRKALPLFGCGVLLLNWIMAVIWDHIMPVGWILLALQLAVVVLQFWSERTKNKEE